MTNQNEKTLELLYFQLEGYADVGYYVDIIVRSEDGDSAPVRMAIDTGAMITCVPADLLKGKGALYGKPVLLRDAAGYSRRTQTYKVDILILEDGSPWDVARPFRGVIGRDNCDHGFLGMDVLQHYDLLLSPHGGMMAPAGGGK